MDLKRRLKLFLLGLGLGSIAAYLIFGPRLTNGAWTPQERVKLRMRSTLVHAAPDAQRTLDSLGLDLAALRGAMDSCTVDFSESRRTDDSLFYAISGPVNGCALRFTVAALRNYEVDSTARLLDIGPAR
jgi:hypothetical protein